MAQVKYETALQRLKEFAYQNGVPVEISGSVWFEIDSSEIETWKDLGNALEVTSTTYARRTLEYAIKMGIAQSLSTYRKRPPSFRVRFETYGLELRLPDTVRRLSPPLKGGEDPSRTGGLMSSGPRQVENPSRIVSVRPGLSRQKTAFLHQLLSRLPDDSKDAIITEFVASDRTHIGYFFPATQERRPLRSDQIPGTVAECLPFFRKESLEDLTNTIDFLLTTKKFSDPYTLHPRCNDWLWKQIGRARDEDTIQPCPSAALDSEVEKRFRGRLHAWDGDQKRTFYAMRFDWITTDRNRPSPETQLKLWHDHIRAEIRKEIAAEWQEEKAV